MMLLCHQMASERCLILNLLVLLYHNKLALCSASRWAGLSRLLGGLTSQPICKRDKEIDTLHDRTRQLSVILLIEVADFLYRCIFMPSQATPQVDKVIAVPVARDLTWRAS